ncbi:MAG: MerR family transcriptional regulator, partial [Synechococcaceae cyanobacterium]|nr:MerR family transcriptional regulator [Synechococcaceae cyanobacterium]
MDHSAPLSPPLPTASEVYGLEELLAAAGERLGEEITPRTVRLYATQGLIDRPGREGRSAVYGRRHLLQLLLIRSLARRGLSLAAIAPLIGLADGELEQQLNQLEGDGSPASSLLAAMAADIQAAAPATAPAAAGSPQSGDSPVASEERNEALDYLRSLQSTSPEASPAATDAMALPTGIDSESLERSASLLPLLGSPLSSRSPSRSSSSPSSRSSRSPSRSGGSREAASRWHRFTLAPGVELQISDSVSVPPPGSRRMAWLNRL